MKRRDFTKSAGMGLLAMQSFPAIALNEVLKKATSGSTRIPLGLCNHSLRSLNLNAQQLIEYAIEKKLDSVLLNTFQPFDLLDSEYLAGLSRLAKSNNVSIYIGAGSISEKSKSFSGKYGNAATLLKEGIRVAKTVGSPIVGVRIGSIEDRYVDGGIEVHIESVMNLMKSVRSQVLDAGIKFAFENHAGDLRSEELLALINETGTDICGALFDPANAVWAMEDPMKALETLGSTIVCTSVRDLAVWETNEGAMFQGMAIGEGMLDFQSYAKTMVELCPGVPLHVETISNSARPIPFFKPEFWKGFPRLKATDIVDFLNLAKKGKPLEISTPPVEITQKDFDIGLQRAELIKSFDYLRKDCNTGLKS
ncbi:MAG: TIM barrel protein [Prolixibacteraceae bacterium]|nr:TIM barrel protein [Prolixibacteraceae bacterium]